MVFNDTFRLHFRQHAGPTTALAMAKERPRLRDATLFSESIGGFLLLQ